MYSTNPWNQQLPTPEQILGTTFAGGYDQPVAFQHGFNQPMNTLPMNTQPWNTQQQMPFTPAMQAPFAPQTLVSDEIVSEIVSTIATRPELLASIAWYQPQVLVQLATSNASEKVFVQVAATRPDLLAYAVAVRPEILAHIAATNPESLIKPLRVAPELFTLVAQYNPAALVQLFTVEPQLLAKAAAAVPEAIVQLLTFAPQVLVLSARQQPEIISQLLTTKPDVVRQIVALYPTFVVELARTNPDAIITVVRDHADVVTAAIEARPEILIQVGQVAPHVLSAIMQLAPSVIRDIARSRPEYVGYLVQAAGLAGTPQQFGTIAPNMTTPLTQPMVAQQWGWNTQQALGMVGTPNMTNVMNNVSPYATQQPFAAPFASHIAPFAPQQYSWGGTFNAQPAPFDSLLVSELLSGTPAKATNAKRTAKSAR